MKVRSAVYYIPAGILLLIIGLLPKFSSAQTITTGMTRSKVTKVLSSTPFTLDKRSVIADSFLWAGFYGHLVVQFDKGLTSHLVSWNADGDPKKGYLQCEPLLNSVNQGSTPTIINDQDTWTEMGNTNGTAWRLTYLKQSGRISYVATLLE